MRPRTTEERNANKHKRIATYSHIYSFLQFSSLYDLTQDKSAQGTVTPTDECESNKEADCKEHGRMNEKQEAPIKIIIISFPSDFSNLI